MTDMTETLRPLVESVYHVVSARVVTAWWLDPVAGQFSLVYAHGQPATLRQAQGATSTTAYKLADSPLSRQALTMGSARAEPDAVETLDAALPPGVGSVLALRLGSAEQPLGLLFVQMIAPHTFTPGQVTALQALSALGSTALAAVRRIADLEGAEASRVQFMHITTHELRSPLAVSQTLIRNVVKGYAGPLTDKQHDVFRRISRQLDALESLINDLLDLAASRGSAVISEPVLLSASVGRSVLLLQPSAEEKNVELTLHPCREELVVRATEDGLDRIFVNLVGNAVKYTSPGGRVTVSLARRDKDVTVVVEDTGIGIPAESLSHLFEEFYRAPNVRAASISGTGLGLAIVKELVQRFRGQIQVESEVGRGTIFTISFPLGR